jgi:hypothetical protein
MKFEKWSRGFICIFFPRITGILKEGSRNDGNSDKKENWSMKAIFSRLLIKDWIDFIGK